MDTQIWSKLAISLTWKSCLFQTFQNIILGYFWHPSPGCMYIYISRKSIQWRVFVVQGSLTICQPLKKCIYKYKYIYIIYICGLYYTFGQSLKILPYILASSLFPPQNVSHLTTVVWAPQNKHQLSHDERTSYFPLNPGWLIGILIMVYYNPYITG